MCNSYLSYADVYNELYASNSREECVKRLIKRCRSLCLSHRMRMIKHIHTALSTQTPFEKLDATETHEQCIVTHKMFVVRTRRLARRMLSHTYRPSGRMMRRIILADPFISN